MQALKLSMALTLRHAQADRNSGHCYTCLFCMLFETLCCTLCRP